MLRRMSSDNPLENPLLENPLLEESELPRFDLVRPEHVEPGMHALLERLEHELSELEAQAQPTWTGLVEPLERITLELEARWGVANHLMGVRNSDELRAAYEAVQPEVVKFATRMGQSRPLYDAAVDLRDGDGWSQLDPGQQRIVSALVRDAELSGVGLDGAERTRFNAIQLELADLQTRFGNHVLDATKAFERVLDDAAEVEGLPPSALELAAQSAREAGRTGATAEQGPWRITLDYPSLVPFLEHARRRDLREQLYRAHVTRASTGEVDNTPLIARLLELRVRQLEVGEDPHLARLRVELNRVFEELSATHLRHALIDNEQRHGLIALLELLEQFHGL